MNKLLLKQIFSSVYNAISEQGMPSMNSGSVCLYRGPSGTKCAAGHLIRDEDYSEHFEGLNVFDRDVKQALEKGGVPEDLLVAVCTFQRFHDNAARHVDNELFFNEVGDKASIQFVNKFQNCMKAFYLEIFEDQYVEGKI